MKYYITFTFFLLLALMFTSCGHDDIDTLNGEWSLISSITEGSETGICDGQNYSNEFKSVL